LIRAVLAALSKIPDFIPAETLQQTDLDTVSLTEVIRSTEIPWFYFEKVEDGGETIHVDVSHGIPEAAIGETFVFRKILPNLELVDRQQTWIS
jgi:hypothetical protein